MTPVGPAAEPIQTPRLSLEPLAVSHAEEMVEVLGAPELYDFTGGTPPTLPELAERYRRQTAGPPAPRHAGWLNWVIRRREDRRLAGTVQATIVPESAGLRASVAWVIGAAWQGRGYATESARALVSWLREHEVATITASIHPDHTASAAVARRAGLVPTPECDDGEIIWRLVD